MRVSVITAVKNGAATLADTLSSVSRQRYPDIEHIVVDGRSSDDTLRVVRQHGQHVATVVSEADSGPYEAFNRGLQLATGGIVAFLNADDLYESDEVIANVVRELEPAGVDLLFGDVLLVRADDVRSVTRYYRSGALSRARLARGIMPAHPATFVKRSIYERFGGFDTSYRIAGDFEWTVRVVSDSSVASKHLPQVLVRMREGGLSTRGIRSKIRITREVRRACREHGLATSYLRLLSRLPEKILQYRDRPPTASGQ
jgi:glycosyltransferase involved in cell wall biosynthesis